MPTATDLTNLEAAASDYARTMERKYIAKRGGSVPAWVALNVWISAYDSFLRRPDRQS